MNSKIMTIIFLSLWIIAVYAQQGSSLASSSATTTSSTLKNYAILNIKCGAGVTEPDGDLISDRLRAEIFNTGNANVMERNQMQEILKEQGFQQSGATCTDEDCLVKMGQMLGVHYLVAGSLGKLGSMYMVNMRTIDVQTGKIVRAVSVDVKGDIEDLVDYLPRIALQLTTDTKKVSQSIKTEDPVTPKPPKDTVKAVVEPEPAVDTTPVIAETPKEPKEPQDNSSKSGRNKNRAGIGVMFDLYGKTGIYDGSKLVDTLRVYNLFGDDSQRWIAAGYTEESKPTFGFGLRFIVRAGQVLTIDIGPSLLSGGTTYKNQSLYYDTSVYEYYTSNSTLSINYTVPSVRIGLNFVKRWFPVKMNLGLFANIALPITKFELQNEFTYDIYSSNNKTSSDDGLDLDFKVGFGTRTGVEIMAGSHVGFAFDFLFNFIQWKTKFVFGDLGTETQFADPEYKIIFPRFGFGMGINYYY
jgi:TolB-like protein